METITINWHGPYGLDRFHHHDTASSFGIYAISRIYRGKERLMYIGKTERGFSTRIKEHQGWLQLVQGDIRIRLGELTMEEGKKYSIKKLSDVEALLITYYKPEENTLNSSWYYGRTELIVINKGRKGLLDSFIGTDQLDWV